MDHTHCPFAVGNRVRSKGPIINGIPQHSTEPVAVITKITDKGFEYKFETLNVISPRLNIAADTGLCYPSGYGSYELVP